MAKGCSYGANGHRQNQAAIAICLGQISHRATGYVAIPATFTSLGNIQPLGMHLATKRGPTDALVAGLFGFPQIANCFVFNIPNKAVSRRFDGAAPGENLKRILDERRTEVNRQKFSLAYRQLVVPKKGLGTDARESTTYVANPFLFLSCVLIFRTRLGN
jgi:hypothetical protein